MSILDAVRIGFIAGLKGVGKDNSSGSKGGIIKREMSPLKKRGMLRNDKFSKQRCHKPSSQTKRTHGHERTYSAD